MSTSGGSIPTGLPLPGLRLALGTLSILRVPVDSADRRTAGRAMAWAPAVGLGLGLTAAAAGWAARAYTNSTFLAAVVVIQFATAPLSAHMVGRQAYRNGRLDTESLVDDELRDAGATDADAPGEDDGPGEDDAPGTGDTDRGRGGRSRWPAR